MPERFDLGKELARLGMTDPEITSFWENPGDSAPLIGDDERERYSGHLSAMYAQGYLRLEEFRQRMEAVSLCRTQEQLGLTVRQLPPVPAPAPEPEPPEPRRPWRERHWLGLAVTRAAASLMIAAVIPAGTSAACHGFAAAGAPEVTVNIAAIIIGVISVIISLILIGIGADAEEERARLARKARSSNCDCDVCRMYREN